MKDLFSLLPAVHRLRDAAQGDPAARAAERDRTAKCSWSRTTSARLYDNWFIETCDEWVVPYIADLLGVRALPGVVIWRTSRRFSQRSYVANTLAYRRRKGTAAVLEQLASDITGLALQGCGVLRAHGCDAARESSARPLHQFTADVREPIAIQLYGTPVRAGRAPGRRAPHRQRARQIQRAERGTVPVAAPELSACEDVSARKIDAQRYTFDPLGRNVALFNMPQTEAIGDAGDRARQRADADFAAGVAR